jgi:hypothetical protein
MEKTIEKLDEIYPTKVIKPVATPSTAKSTATK